jgi:hypothetical protein
MLNHLHSNILNGTDFAYAVRRIRNPPFEHSINPTMCGLSLGADSAGESTIAQGTPNSDARPTLLN